MKPEHKRAGLYALLLLALWSVIFLPMAGFREYRGEEPRRVIPAREMLETGDWIVPTIGGEIYTNKPPMINWAVAALFSLSGNQSEGTARMVSAIAILALVMTAFSLLGPIIGIRKSAFVGIVLLTPIAMIDKGRTIEIEPLFVALFGIACFVWIRFRVNRSSEWLLWLVPYLFLALAFLTKGPVHMVFWGLFVILTLRADGDLKLLLRPAHLAAVALFIGICGSWVLASMKIVGTKEDSLGNWASQITERADFSSIDFGSWVMHPFQMLGDFLPWTVPLLFVMWVRRKSAAAESGRFASINRAASGTVVLSMIGICLLPGGLPRYLMPVYPLAALYLVHTFFELEKQHQESYSKFAESVLRWSTVLVALVVVGGAIYLKSQAVAVVWPVFLFGLLFLSLLAVFSFVWKGELGFFLQGGLFVTASLVAAIPLFLPFEAKDGTIRDYAQEINSLAGNEGSVVAYVESTEEGWIGDFRFILLYGDDRLQTIGEGDPPPLDADVLVGFQGKKEKLDPIAAMIGLHPIPEVRLPERGRDTLLIYRRAPKP